MHAHPSIVDSTIIKNILSWHKMQSTKKATHPHNAPQRVSALFSFGARGVVYNCYNHSSMSSASCESRHLLLPNCTDSDKNANPMSDGCTFIGCSL